MKKTTEKESWPVEVKSGSAVVKIYRTQKSSGYVSYSAVYYKGRERKVRFFQELAEAKAEAKRIADDITEGEHISLELTAGQRLAVKRALEIATQLGIPVDVAVSKYAEAYRHLHETGADVAEVCRKYAKQNAGSVLISVPAAVELFKSHMAADGKSQKHQQHLATVLNRFAESFNIDVQSLTPTLISDYLTSLICKERTKRNCRDSLGYFGRWLVLRRFLPKGPDVTRLFWTV